MAVEETDTKNTQQTTDTTPVAQEAAPVVSPLKKDTRDINKTAGGRTINFINNWLLGFVANSSFSVFLTYFFNSKPKVKEVKENITKGAMDLFGIDSSNPDSKAYKGVMDQVRTGVEILFMTVSGSLVTLIMTPLVSNRENIAYKINQMLGKDTDVLPESMKKEIVPQNEQERIELAIRKRVTDKQVGGDLWKARFTTLAAVITGDQILNRVNRTLEENNHASVDTALLALGRKAHGQMSEATVDKYAKWFDDHNSGIKDMKENSRDHYERLAARDIAYDKKQGGTGEINEGRITISEQTRILGKEIGWTLILAGMVEKWTESFRKSRVAKERKRAIEALKNEGVIPRDWVDGKPYTFTETTTHTEIKADIIIDSKTTSVPLNTAGKEAVEAAVKKIAEEPKREAEAARMAHAGAENQSKEIAESAKQDAKSTEKTPPHEEIIIDSKTTGVPLNTAGIELVEAAVKKIAEAPKREAEAAGVAHASAENQSKEIAESAKQAAKFTEKTPPRQEITPRKDAPVETMNLQGAY